MDGVLNVYKPQGPTSHDIVYAVRKLFGQKRVGHTGTLDPMATGVLVICLGKATRIVEYLTGQPKEYRARMILGQTSDTQDSTGRITSESDASGVTREAFEAVVQDFVGEVEQVPPMVSAIKHEGKPLYKLAREGKTIERAARMITVYSIEVLDFVFGKHAEAEFIVRCSSGTYIRTLCADIGERLGCGGLMSQLERTSVGKFVIENACKIEQLEAMNADGRLADAVQSINESLSGVESISICDSLSASVLHGNAVAVSERDSSPLVRILAQSGDLLGLGVVESANGRMILKPKKILVDVDV